MTAPAGGTSRPAAVEPGSVGRRQTDVKPFLAVAVVLPLLAACSSAHPPDAAPGSGGTSLSQGEVAKADAVAHRVIEDQGATVSGASVLARPGRVADSDTGHPCTSGRELRIKLIGTFPHTVTTGHPVPPGSPAPDFTVRAMIVTADAESGRACLIGVQTGERGKVEPLPGGTILALR